MERAIAVDLAKLGALKKLSLLKQRLADGDAEAAVLLAREYAGSRKNRESCVCIRIAQLLNPEVITPEDVKRNAEIWESIGNKTRNACMEKAAQCVRILRPGIAIPQ